MSTHSHHSHHSHHSYSGMGHGHPGGPSLGGPPMGGPTGGRRDSDLSDAFLSPEAYRATQAVEFIAEHLRNEDEYVQVYFSFPSALFLFSIQDWASNRRKWYDGHVYLTHWWIDVCIGERYISKCSLHECVCVCASSVRWLSFLSTKTKASEASTEAAAAVVVLKLCLLLLLVSFFPFSKIWWMWVEKMTLCLSFPIQAYLYFFAFAHTK